MRHYHHCTISILSSTLCVCNGCMDQKTGISLAYQSLHSTAQGTDGLPACSVSLMSPLPCSDHKKADTENTEQKLPALCLWLLWCKSQSSLITFVFLIKWSCWSWTSNPGKKKYYLYHTMYFRAISSKKGKKTEKQQSHCLVCFLSICFIHCSCSLASGINH